MVAAPFSRHGNLLQESLVSFHPGRVAHAPRTTVVGDGLVPARVHTGMSGAGDHKGRLYGFIMEFNGLGIFQCEDAACSGCPDGAGSSPGAWRRGLGADSRRCFGDIGLRQDRGALLGGNGNHERS